MVSSSRPLWGTITVRKATDQKMESGGYRRVEFYCWRPPSRIRSELPRNFTFELWCAHRPDGERVFFPHPSTDTVLLQGALGGLALLIACKHPSKEQLQSYRLMYFLFQAMQKRREFQNRLFQYSRDLYLRQNSREEDNTRTVLPPFLGQSREGRGHAWTISELMEQGALTAEEFEIRRPSQKQIIHCGLFAAARRCPLTVPPDQIEGLIRASLFQSGASSEIDETTKDQIEERVSRAVHQHLNVGTNTEFMNWLSGGTSSFVKQLADQKKAPGGRIAQQVVRDVLLELGWQAYHYMAGCFSLQAQAFKQAIPDPLSASEQARFDRIFLPHPALGNFPLLMIRQRITAFNQAFLVYWETGDETMIPVFHQLLNFYAFMSNERRNGDRRGQQISRAQRLPGGYRTIGSFEEDLGNETWRVQDHTVDAEEANGTDPE